MELLPDSQIQAYLEELNGWIYKNKGLEKSFQFANFKIAWAFMSKVAEIADEIDHHPEWFNVYNRVDIRLTTHDKKGLTELDAMFAKSIEKVSEIDFS